MVSIPGKKTQIRSCGSPAARVCKTTGKLFQAVLDPIHRLDDIFPEAESAESEIAFAMAAETGARRSDHLHFLQQLVEKLPRGKTGRHLQPDVGRVDATIYGIARGLQAFADDTRILHIVRDVF